MVLIGTSTYSDESLPPLPSVVHNIEDFKALLTDPELCDLESENIVVLLDKSHASVVQAAVAQAADEAMDTLFVYYAGHGLMGDRDNELFLAVCDSTQKRSVYDAIPATTLKRAMSESPAKRKVLIVDSCFSGRLTHLMSPSEGTPFVRAELEEKGTYLIASAPANKPAVAPEGERHTAFTGVFLSVLKGGLNNGDTHLRLDEVFTDVRSRLGERRFPDPQRVGHQDVGNWRFLINRYSASADSRIQALQDRIKSQDRTILELRETVATQSANAGVSGVGENPDLESQYVELVQGLGVQFFVTAVLFSPLAFGLWLTLASESFYQSYVARWFLLGGGMLASLVLLLCFYDDHRSRRKEGASLFLSLLGPASPSRRAIGFTSVLVILATVFTYAYLVTVFA